MIDDFDVAVFGVAELAHPFLKGTDEVRIAGQ
jgi:hypothetical protein